MYRFFEAENISASYHKYRPATPDFLVGEILQWMNASRPLDAAADLGCGSGQHTLTLAPHFRRVHAFDVSEEQIREARRHPAPDHVSYAVAPAEALPLPDLSVQLVTGSNSFHWFDFEKFFAEVDRVLVPHGVVAAVGVKPIPTVVGGTRSGELNQLLTAFRGQHLAYRSDRVIRYCGSGYAELPLPYEEERRLRDLPFVFSSSLDFLLGTLHAMIVVMYRDDPGKMVAPLDEFRKGFLAILGLDADVRPEDVPLELCCMCYVAMCRKPGPSTS